MDPLDFLEPSELLNYFHTHKTEMSCMETPHSFLSQLRDHNLIPEDRYKKIIRMKSKNNLRRAVYDILDWLETKNSKYIRVFWRCVFKDVMMNQYPTLKLLHKSLMDGSYHFDSELPSRVESEESDERGSSKLSDREEKQTKSAKKKRKVRSDGDDEQPGPATEQTPASPKKGEMKEIWTWPLYMTQLPVTCGKVEGTLRRERLAQGQKCIVVDNQWFTPAEFEKFAGKESSRNWKLSIRCAGTPLGKLIKAKKSLFATSHSNTEDSEDEESPQDAEASTGEATGEEEEMEEWGEPAEVSPDHDKRMFKVTCGALTGTLYKDRFGSGKCGKSIRTEMSWLSPVEFVNVALNQSDASWKKEILYNGEPLSVLIEAKVLMIHSLLCKCKLCRPEPQDLESQKNDDECCICKTEGEDELVVCDSCPRSFHQDCHLPHIDDSIVRDDGQWLCTFCVFKAMEGCRYPDKQNTEVAMSRQISQHMLECPYLLLCLCSADEEQIFSTNPVEYLESYSSIIRAPMWLEKIADKLQSKEYQTVGEFVSDVQLIFTNSATFNRNNPEYLGMGEQLKQLFEREFKKAFNIQD